MHGAQQECSYWWDDSPSQPHLLLDGLAVRSEYFEFVLPFSMQVIVQGFIGDRASHHRFAILPVEKNHVPPEYRTLHGRGKRQLVPLQAPLHAADDKRCERMDVHLDAGTVQHA